MPIPTKGTSRYIAGLDGLRGIAVLSVIVYHLNLGWAPGGLLGVVIFFVLSGYLITDLCLADWKRNETINLKNFWIRRIQRLLPALLVMLIVVTTWVTLFERSLLTHIRGDLLATLFNISNWWYIFHKISYFESFGTPSPIMHLWSLAVEEQFYIVWPFLLSFGLKLRRISTFVWLIALIAVISALLMGFIYRPGTDPSRVYYGTDTRVFSLLFGSCLAIIWPAKRLSKKVPKAAILALDMVGSISLLTLLLLICRTNQYDPFLYRGGMVLTSIASVLLVSAVVHPASILSKLMGFKPLRWIGVRSYGIYLWHYPVIVLIKPTIDSGKLDLLRMTLQICCIFILSALSWRFIENPIRLVGIVNIWMRIKLGEFSVNKIPLFQRIVLGCFIVMIGVSCVGMSSSATENKQILPNKLSSTQVNEQQTSNKNERLTALSNQESDLDRVKAAGPRITVIGDSVMVGVAPYLEKEFPDILVDAKIGRQMSEATSVVDRMKSDGKLGNIIVIELGTNGPFTQNQLFSLINTLGKQRKILLVNSRVSRPWEQAVNSILMEAADSFPNVSLVNWHDESIGKESYFYPDGVHPNQKGSQIYASLIAEAAGFKVD